MASGSCAWSSSAPAPAATPAPGSDYDVAVFLKDLDDRWTELERLGSIGSDPMDETGAFLHAMPYRAAPTGNARR